MTMQNMWILALASTTILLLIQTRQAVLLRLKFYKLPDVQLSTGKHTKVLPEIHQLGWMVMTLGRSSMVTAMPMMDPDA